MSPADIARGLTAAQRRALLAMVPGHWFWTDRRRRLGCLRRTALVRVEGRSAFLLTPLGVQVRAEVERMEEKETND
jgi:hypothetical protein